MFFSARTSIGFEVMICLLCLLTFQAEIICSFGAGSNDVSGWEMKDSLPINKVIAVVQSQDGYLWLSNFDGLRRYDGVSFKLYNKANTPTLPSNLITCLFVDHNGVLWIGCDNGKLACLNDGQFKAQPLPPGWPTASIDRICESYSGTIWALNHLGKLMFISDHRAARSVESFAESSGKGTISLIQDMSGKVWLVQGSKLLEVVENQIVGTQLQLPVESGAPVVFPAHAGGFWVVDNNRLRRWAGNDWAEDRGHHDCGEIIPSLSMETSSGVVLIPTFRNGLFIINHQGQEQQPINQDVLARDSTYCVCEDREGSIWVGTGSGGLDILRPRAVRMLDPPDHWLGQPVITVAPQKQGGLFIGTQAAAVYHFDHGLFTSLSRIRNQINPVVRCLWEDTQNTLWIGTIGAGLWHGSLGVYEPAGPTNDFPKQINAIFETKSGNMWFGTDEGPVQLQNGKWRFLAREFHIPNADTRCFAEGPDGTIWVGMQGGGLGRFAHERWTQFLEADGLASDYVWALATETDGTVWIGTYGDGLCRYKGGHFTTLAANSGLPNEVICSILDDQKGHFWISSYAGIIRVEKANLERCADDKSKLINSEMFGFKEGLTTLQFSGGCEPAACRTADGRLWFPCNDGLAMIDPSVMLSHSPLTPVVLQDLVIDGESVTTEESGAQETLAGRKACEIAPGHHHVEIRYVGISFSSSDRVHYRYRMKGLEQDWIEAGNQKFAYYSYLPPGHYSFQVIACNKDNVWNQPGTELKLIVDPHVWQTWWFMGGTALASMSAAALVATGVSRRREREKRAEMEQQRKSDIERARIARDIHDQLGIGLTRISMLSLTAIAQNTKPADAQKNIHEIQTTTSDLTRSMDEIVWAVNPKHDTLDSLLTYLGEFARKFLETGKIRCRLDLPILVPRIPLSADRRHHFFLVFQESLNNVVKHAAATEVSITAELKNSELVLAIQDNGRGFVHQQELESVQMGNGLNNMKDRMHNVGGQFECESQTGFGTTIRLIIPIPA